MATLDELVQSAGAALRAAADDGPISVIVDPTLADPLGEMRKSKDHSDATRGEWAATSVHKLPFIHADFDPLRQPYLLHLPSESKAERVVSATLTIALSEALGEYGSDYQGRSVCGFVVHDDTPRQTALRLARLAQITRPDGQPWYLRFWDPRVLRHLPHMLPPKSWHILAAGLAGWHTLNIENQLAPIAPPPPGDAQPHLPAFDARTWERLGRVGSINKLMAMCPDWSLQPSDALARRIERLLIQCEGLGFTTEQDGLVFAACALTSHEEFHHHPRVADALHIGKRDGSSLAPVLSQFNDEFWLEVAAGGWTQRNDHLQEST